MDWPINSDRPQLFKLQQLQTLLQQDLTHPELVKKKLSPRGENQSAAVKKADCSNPCNVNYHVSSTG